MIDRDRASAPSSRKQPTGDILYRQGLLTPFEGGLARPERRILSAPGLRRIPLPIPSIATRTAPSREQRECVSNVHYHYFLV